MPPRDLLFYATHVVDATDAKLLRQTAASLDPERARLWVLLKEDDASAASLAATMSHLRPSERVRHFAWSAQHVFAMFPAIASAVAAATNHGWSRLYSLDNSSYARYHYNHAALALWNATHGDTDDAAAAYWWRVEPDVLLSGPSWQPLFDSLGTEAFDLVLPRYDSFARDPHYPHWADAAALLEGLHPSRRLWSLVSVGRYSREFVRLLTVEMWARGRVGYEEVSLPAVCMRMAAKKRCAAASFATPGMGLPTLRLPPGGRAVAGRHFRFRPEFGCAEYLDARRNETMELWHPVKDRQCVARALGV